MKPSEIDALVSMPDRQYESLIRALEQAEAAAYSNYTGCMPSPAPGTPQAISHGTVVGGFRGQEEWIAAQRTLKDAKLCRTASQGMSIGWRYKGNGVYLLVGIDTPARMGVQGPHQIELVTHGVNVDDCDTPTQAIRKVQAAHA